MKNNDKRGDSPYNFVMKILIIEDEKGLSEAISHILRKRGSLVIECADGKEGLDEALSGIYDIIVLDVMLPSLDGFTILKRVRAEGVSTPILMLTARADLSSRVEGLNLGADYYLPKPFEMDELVACINALSRRKETQIESSLSFGDITLKKDESLLVVKDTGEKVKLSARENTLMEMLIASGGRIIDKERIFEKLWGYDSESEYNSAEVYISFLRKKLKYVGSETKIKAVRGIGYALETKDD